MQLNGPGYTDHARRYVGNLNMSFAHVEGESLLMGLKVRILVSCCDAAPATLAACSIQRHWMLQAEMLGCKHASAWQGACLKLDA